MEKVLADKNLAAYRGKFPKPKQPISRNYQCQTPKRVEIDSTAVDSLAIEGVDIDNLILPVEE